MFPSIRLISTSFTTDKQHFLVVMVKTFMLYSYSIFQVYNRVLVNYGLPWYLRRWRIHLQCRRPWFKFWVRKSAGEGKGSPLQYSDLETSMDCIVHEVAKSPTGLSNCHFHSQTLTVSKLYIRPPEPIHLTTESLYPLMSIFSFSTIPSLSCSFYVLILY